MINSHGRVWGRRLLGPPGALINKKQECCSCAISCRPNTILLKSVSQLLDYIVFLNRVESISTLSVIFFSSPELKAQVSFSDRLSSGVCPSVCLSVCKLFLFSTSSQEPLGQFQPNLAQSILGWRGFNFVQMKGPALFQGEIIMKYQK